MPISSIAGSSVAAFSGSIVSPGPAAAGAAGGSPDAALIANLAADSSGVSAAIQSLSGALGTIINTTA